MNRSLHRALLLLLVGLLLSGPPLVARADQDPDQALAAALQRGETDPAAALGEVEALLLRSALAPALREATARARAGLLVRAGRRAEGEAAWRALLARGDAQAPAALLGLAGARLEARLAEPARPGAPARVAIAGAATGPLQVRLYALDLPRWRALGETPRERERDLFARLRAPPASLLRNVASWDHPGLPAGERASDELRTPPLEAGVHLLLVEARGVPLAIPLLVSRAQAVVRRGGGPGLLWLVDAASGAPLAGVELERLDEAGRAGTPLAPTGPDGVTRFEGPAGYALAWFVPGADPGGAAGPTAALFPLPPEAPPTPPSPPAAWPELPAAAPGATAWTVIDGLPPGEGAPAWTLGPPALLGLLSGQAVGRRSDAALLALPLPEAAPAGAWRLLCEASPLPLAVRPPASPQVRLELEAPTGVAPAPGEPLTFAVRALLPDERPLAGRRLTWSLLRHPAAPRAEHLERGLPPEGEPAPLAPHARRLLAAAPSPLAQGELRLDARGEARWVVPAPALLAPALVSVRLRLDEPDGLRAEALRLLAWAPSRVWLELVLPRETTPVGRVMEVELRASRPDGSPIPDLDLALLAAPEGAAGPGERRALRTGPGGVARAFLTPTQPGQWRLEARSQGGPPVRAGLLVIGKAGQGAPAAGPARLILEARHEEQPELVLLFPGLADGPALLLLEGEGAALDAPRLLELRGGAARAPLTLPGVPARALALAPRAGVVHAAALELPRARAPLAVRARVVAWPAPDRVELAVEVRDAAGAPAPALVTASLLPAEAAAIAARFPAPAPQVLVRARGDGDAALPAPEAAPDPQRVLEALPHPGVSSGVDAPRGEARLVLPVSAGDEQWIRVRASAGARGEAWLPLRVAAPLEVRIAAPDHVCCGDRGQLRALVRARELATLPPGTTLRLTWSAEGLDLGRPHVEGAKVLPGAEAGPEELVVEATPRLELVLPLSATRAGSGRVIVGATLLETAIPTARAEQRIAALEPGWPRARCAAGRVEPGQVARVTLEGPRGAVPRSARLALALDPDPATAVLAGQEALLATPGLTAGLAARWVERAGLAPLTRAWRLSPARPPLGAPAGDALWTRLLAARQADGGWGARTARWVELLVELRQAGEPVPRALLEGGLDALAAQEPRSPAVEALLLRAGRVPLPLQSLDEAALRAAPPGELLARGAALLERGEPVAAAAAVAAASARREELRGPRQLAELLRLEQALGRPADVALIDSLLATRSGPGWDDPLEAGSALVALAQAAAGAPAPGGARLRVRFQDDDPHGTPLYEAWSGGGLAEWPGPLVVEGNRVAGRPTLRLESDAAAWWSARLEALVRPPSLGSPGQGAQAGLSLRLALRQAPDGPPVGAAGAAAGETVWLEVSLGASDGGGLAGTLLELPLPGGARPLRLPAGASLEGGVLRWEPDGERLLLPLLALDPGDWSLPPARLRDLARPEREAWSGALRLRVR